MLSRAPVAEMSPDYELSLTPSPPNQGNISEEKGMTENSVGE